MSSLNNSNFSSTKYCQKINKIRLSEAFLLCKCFVLSGVKHYFQC